MGMTPRTGRTSSGIPRSRGASRETSPNRYSGGYGQRRVVPGTRSGITPDRPPKKPDITERILEQSQKAENDLAKALVSVSMGLPYYRNSLLPLVQIPITM